jgi:hypothetical protein
MGAGASASASAKAATPSQLNEAVSSLTAEQLAIVEQALMSRKDAEPAQEGDEALRELEAALGASVTSAAKDSPDDLLGGVVTKLSAVAASRAKRAPKNKTVKIEAAPTHPHPHPLNRQVTRQATRKMTLKRQDSRKEWATSFLDTDPRRDILQFFEPGDERGPKGLLRSKSLEPSGNVETRYFSVWRRVLFGSNQRWAVASAAASLLAAALSLTPCLRSALQADEPGRDPHDDGGQGVRQGPQRQGEECEEGLRLGLRAVHTDHG